MYSFVSRAVQRLPYKRSLTTQIPTDLSSYVVYTVQYNARTDYKRQPSPVLQKTLIHSSVVPDIQAMSNHATSSSTLPHPRLNMSYTAGSGSVLTVGGRWACSWLRVRPTMPPAPHVVGPQNGEYRNSSTPRAGCTATSVGRIVPVHLQHTFTYSCTTVLCAVVAVLSCLVGGAVKGAEAGSASRSHCSRIAVDVFVVMYMVLSSTGLGGRTYRARRKSVALLERTY